MIVQHEAGITRTMSRSGSGGGERAEEVAHVDRRPAAGAGGVAGEDERLLVDDVVEPDGHGYAPPTR